MAQWLARWAGDSNVAGSIRGRATLLSVLRQGSLHLVASSVRWGREMSVSCAGKVTPCASKRSYVIFR